MHVTRVLRIPGDEQVDVLRGPGLRPPTTRYLTLLEATASRAGVRVSA